MRMLRTLSTLIETSFTPPRYIAPPLAGVDLSASGVKAVRLGRHRAGLVLERYADVPLPPEEFTNGEIANRAAIVTAVRSAMQQVGISAATASLPETKSYLFETVVTGDTKDAWRLGIEQHLEELVPLPPPAVAFDVLEVGRTPTKDAQVVGVGFARHAIDDLLAVFDEAKLTVRALETENFATARSLLPAHDTSTALLIDMGKTTTKICIVTGGIPRFATTIGIGGHALTLAIQKHLGVTEIEARKVKAEQGIVPSPGKEDLLGAMLSTVSAIRDEIASRLDYWQAKAVAGGLHEPVTHALLVGGNATLRGLQEYLQSALRIPVATGDVFTRFASREEWLPDMEHNESLAYATAIGLALRDDVV